MKIITLELGALGTNCYIVSSDGGNAAVIDPADEADVILGTLEKNGLTLKMILLTHGHFDHTGAAARLIKETGARVYIHESDVCMLDDTNKNVAYLLPGYRYESFAADKTVSEGDEIALDEIVFKVMHTPGHTDGSVMYIAGGSIFSGDTLFACGMGRTDFYSGSVQKMKKSLARIAAMEGDMDIYPGHGPATTLETEKAENPYLPDGRYSAFFDSID